MTPTQELKLKAMKLNPVEELAVRQIVDLLTGEQHAKIGEFADQSQVNAGALARLDYLMAEGFTD